MQSFRKAILLGTASLGLSGCAYFDAANISEEIANASGNQSGITTLASQCGAPTENTSLRLSELSLSGLRQVEAHASLQRTLTSQSDFEVGMFFLSPDSVLGPLKDLSPDVERLRDKALREAVIQTGSEILQVSPGFLESSSFLARENALESAEVVEQSDVYRTYFTEVVSTANWPPADQKLNLNTDRTDWVEFNTAAVQSVGNRGWESMAVQEFGRVAKMMFSSQIRYDKTKNVPMLDRAAADILRDARRKTLIASYVSAYFRNGKIVSVDIDASGLTAKLKEKLEAKLPTSEVEGLEAEIDNLVKDLAERVCDDEDPENCKSIGVVGETTFVTRAGKSYGFPGISASFDPVADKKVSTNKISSKEMITDIARVILEASFDSQFQIPGVEKSTFCEVRKEKCQGASADAITKANNFGDRAESAARNITSLIVRGGWIFSLNNETLADLIEVSAGVTARKIAEKAAYDKAVNACSAGPVEVTITPSFKST